MKAAHLCWKLQVLRAALIFAAAMWWGIVALKWAGAW